MAKHCTNCGHELREPDKFCAECGTRVGDVVPAHAKTEQWEYCEIVYEFKSVPALLWGGYHYIHFWASAIGPNGRYSAGQSADLRDAEEPESFKSEHVNTLNEFAARLLADKWEALPTKGRAWFSYKFRRPVKG